MTATPPVPPLPPSPPPLRFAGAVLVGGASTRMGRDKALIDVGGRPMASRVVAALREAGAAPVLVVGGEVADRAGLADRAVPDEHPGEGPLGGLVTALGAADAAWVAVCACDLPWLDAATIGLLVAAAAAALPGTVAVLARTDRPEPLCGLWRRDAALGPLAASFATGERAIHRALAADPRLLVVEVPVAPARLTNVNTPEDLESAVRSHPDR